MDLVRATRTHPTSSWAPARGDGRAVPRRAGGGGPRGRDFVTPDDVKAVAPAVLTHRLVVDLDRSLHGATAGGALAQVLARRRCRRRRA